MNCNVISSLFQSNAATSGVTHNHVFASVVTYMYNCTFHADMNGTDIVQ